MRCGLVVGQLTYNLKADGSIPPIANLSFLYFYYLGKNGTMAEWSNADDLNIIIQ